MAALLRCTLLACFIFATGVLNVRAAEGLPDGAIRLVVPYPPGGVNDVIGRIIAQRLGEVIGHAVIVDNRPGGGTVIGTQYVVNAKADGATLLLINPSTAINVSTQKSLPYDANKDLAAISLVATYPTMLVAGTMLPDGSVRELIEDAKAHPGKLTFASGGYGGSTHLAGELFKKLTGTDILHIPYKGSASTIQALVSGEVSIAFGDPTTYLPLVQSGKLKALAVASPTRFPGAPDVPTMRESGLADYEAAVWLGVAAPAGTPPATIAKLQSAIATVIADPAIAQKMNNQGVVPTTSTPLDFQRLLRAETDKWAGVVKFAGITPE